jgi:hypothetical protein
MNRGRHFGGVSENIHFVTGGAPYVVELLRNFTSRLRVHKRQIIALSRLTELRLFTECRQIPLRATSHLQGHFGRG